MRKKNPLMYLQTRMYFALNTAGKMKLSSITDRLMMLIQASAFQKSVTDWLSSWNT